MSKWCSLSLSLSRMCVCHPMHLTVTSDLPCYVQGKGNLLAPVLVVMVLLLCQLHVHGGEQLVWSRIGDGDVKEKEKEEEGTGVALGVGGHSPDEVDG